MAQLVQPEVERVAAVVERVAVLLEAGVTPASAWIYLDDAASRRPPESTEAVRWWSARFSRAPTGATDMTTRVIAAAADAARHSDDIGAAILREVVGSGGPQQASDAWRAVASAWQVAAATGAPLGQSLRQLATSQRALGRTQRDIAAALAGPRSTSRFVMILPLVGVAFGLILGFDTLGTLFTTIPGLVCLVLGGGLMAVAARWTRMLVNRATPTRSAPGLQIELTAIAVASGASLERAQLAVAAATASAGLSPGESGRGRHRPERRAAREQARDGEADARAIESVLALSRQAGIPAADLLRAEAARVRSDARSAAQQAAAALATSLMAPLGLCVLPAFMLVGVAPMMLSVLASTLRVL